MKKAGFYPKLALDGMRKNGRLYLPFIMTCVSMITVFYILSFLSKAESVASVRGGDIIQSMMYLGAWVMGIFSCIFLFYTNSFLIRRRKKEFGLYNILGMGKKNLALLLLCETVITALGSLIIGLAIGILLSKLFELGLVNIMHAEIPYSFKISLPSVIKTVWVYSLVFFLIYLNALRQIQFSTAIHLLRSENVGEKPPKGNILYAVLGLIFLAAGYFIAITTKNPLAALTLFFIAVLLVIGGTYLTMISGSVIFCKILQKNKKFYYKPNHFVSVSSMVYRMKRNGAGLASICILSTMVLVTVSSTTSLYFGMEKSIMQRHPGEVNITFSISEKDMTPEADLLLDDVRTEMDNFTKSRGGEVSNLIDYRCAYVAGLLSDGVMETDYTSHSMDLTTDINSLYECFILPLEDYNRMMGTHEELTDGEALLYIVHGKYDLPTLTFKEGRTFDIRKINALNVSGEAAVDIVPSIFLIVPDMSYALDGLDRLADYNGDQMVKFQWNYIFDCGLPPEEQQQFTDDLTNILLDQDLRDRTVQFKVADITSREAERYYDYALNGGLFFIGIMLSAVFLLATVLIIYYKQLSEGYEDQSRFGIMQKVGMTKREIKKSINSQVLTVFFLPLAMSAVHIAFAFPIINKLLGLLYLNSRTAFMIATVLSFALFATFYVLVYRITSNSYYKIVSGAKEGKS